MPSPKKNTRVTEAQKPIKPSKPMIGALLRLPREYVVARVLAEANARGFDVSATEIALFFYPGPDGRRPTELARQCYMSRQAMHYVLTELERRDYVERRPGPTPLSTVVYMRKRGTSLVALMRSCVATVEKEWVEHLGEKRFSTLRNTLLDLSTWLGKLD